MKTYDLKITFSDGDTFNDGMDAQTEYQALYLAYWNWEYAEKIEIINVH